MIAPASAQCRFLPGWRGGRAVDCTGLENRSTCKGIGGSNPPLSATFADPKKSAETLALVTDPDTACVPSGCASHGLEFGDDPGHHYLLWGRSRVRPGQ